MATHNKRAVTVVATPGRGTKKENRGRKPASCSREAASKVARQVGQQFSLC